MKIFRVFLVFMVLTLAGCKTQERTVTVEVPTVKTQYSERLQRDSVYLKDSVYIHKKGDTVFVSRYKYLYRDKIRRDTVSRTDTIGVPVEVVKVEQVNVLTAWQRFRIGAFNFLLAGVAGALIYVLRKPVLALIKMIF